VNNDDPISRVAVVGTGLIGAAWAAFFLAQGLDVAATDPAPDAEAELRRRIDRTGPIGAWWADLGRPGPSESEKAQLATGVTAEAAGRCVEELEAHRNRVVAALLRLRAAEDMSR